MKRFLCVLMILALSIAPVALSEETSADEAVKAVEAVDNSLGRNSKGDGVRVIQARLKELGYYVGGIDGNYGAGTERAVRCFEIANAYSSNGILEDNERAWLLSGRALALLPLADAVKAPNGLPGIKVSSGGNYSDAKGQMWLCDTVDPYTGTYYRRVGQVVLNGMTSLTQNGAETKKFYTALYNMKKSGDYQPCMVAGGMPVAATHTFSQDEPAVSGYVDAQNNYPGQNWLYLSNGESDTVEAMSAWLNEHPVVVVYALESPMSGVLTEELNQLYARR